MQFMKQYEAQTYALMRIISGFLFLWHGTQKLLGYPPASYDPPWHVTYIAGGIELVGGVLIMIGLFTAPAAFLASGLMAAAYWMAHASFDNVVLRVPLHVGQRQRHLEHRRTPGVTVSP
jgi:putative oxidoreductase